MVKIYNKILIIVGASSTGKDLTMQKLIENYGFKGCVSHTTRPPRNGEIEGVSYYFINENEFENTDFIERREYKTKDSGGNSAIWKYGLAKSEINLNEKQIVIVDKQGCIELTEYLIKTYGVKPNVVYLFCSEDIIRERMISRGSVSESEMERRIKSDKIDMSDMCLYADLMIDSGKYEVDERCKLIISGIYGE